MPVARNGFLPCPRCRPFALLLAVMLALLAVLDAQARDTGQAGSHRQRYIVELADPPLALYDGRTLSVPAKGGALRLQATRLDAAGAARKLNPRSAAARAYLDFIDGRQASFRLEAGLLLGRQVAPVHRYRMATNGLALDLSPAEARKLAASPLVKALVPDTRVPLDTDAGPLWIGAGPVWSGDAGFAASQGEGSVVGIIDTGINWDHPSFEDPALDGYQYVNPFGTRLGLCDDPEVKCNNKLVGVYDFVEDDPTTDDEEGSTKGKDIDGHGSHVSSIAVGNTLNVFLNSAADATLSGVAPRANLVVYRACHVGSCLTSAILEAIDQAVQDEVDVINFSIGSNIASDPWLLGSQSRAYLAARAAGIFVVTSAGNSGPNPGSIKSPANAPWVVAAGNSTHDRVFANIVRNLTGGATEPPGDLIGAGVTDGTGQKLIVHARDYGFPLCGTGEPESGPSCDDNTGESNPWAGQKPFNGEIVVCDRGTYGRVEKGKNLELAGAGGYILANTPEWGESIVADEHCLPAAHIGLADGNALREWLGQGSGHGGQISGFTLVHDARFADQMNISSSRGPAPPPVQDLLKPNLAAPGTDIIAAGRNGQEFQTLSGTSMSSPHVAGAAALIRSVHTGWSPAQIASALEMTAAPEHFTLDGVQPANPRDRGAGKPQIDQAVNAGLYLNVSQAQFLAADPAKGGDPRTLNLPGLVDGECQRQCSFTRTVTDQMGGGSWSATAVDFPSDVIVDIQPASFSLGNGSSQMLTVTVDVDSAGIVGEWVDGRVRLTAAGSPDQYLTVSVFADGGDLPEAWVIDDDRNGGWKAFTLSGLSALPDATFRVGGLQPAERTVETLVQDPTDDTPYDGLTGVFVKWHSLPQGALWLYAETPASSSEDVDLFVGRDDNGNGIPEEEEEICASAAETNAERCDLFDAEPGDYWVLVQNWTASNPEGDEITLLSAGIAPATGSLAASGPGIVPSGSPFDLRLSWDNLSAAPGEQWLGAVGVGTDRDHPNNVGVIPVRFNRTAVAAATTFPLIDGHDHELALAAGATHDRLFIDVPPGASNLAVTAAGASADQSDALQLELRRLDFTAALANPPFAVAPTGSTVVASASGSGGSGPSLNVSGGSLQPGRWYAVLKNTGGAAAAVTVRADVDFTGTALPIHRGLWEPNSRPGLGQGYDYNWGGSDRALLWYTYDETGQPAWYIADDGPASGNIWTAPLYRVTNDGAEQQLARVGNVTVATLAEDDALFSYTLFGLSGTERMQPLSALTCPQVGGSPRSWTGLWYRGVDGLGGASVIINASTQAQIHYLFDSLGLPRWLVAQDLAEPAPTNADLPMLQFHGYCAVCTAASVGYTEMGTVQRSFSNDSTGSWTLDYLMQAPLSGDVQRTDSIQKLTDTLPCE